MVSNKYAYAPAKAVQEDLEENHNRKISRSFIILPQKSRQFKKKSNSIQNSLSHALILTKST